tara:strand:+ start:1889 stop:4441 length:2553 start_codon:yes stop_codon:yes gene_type:complete
MPKIRSYGTVTPYNSDFIVGTDKETTNVTRNYKVSKIVDIILASLGIGTVTSIATTSGTFVSVTGGTITTAGTITMDISATGTPGATTFLRGDGTWSEPGPAPTTIIGRYNSNLLTSDIDSINFTGAGVSASSSNQDVLLIIPGSGSAVDSVIAGAGISVSGPTGNVTITNVGATQARAGGNVTLSGGTGAVTVSTTANAGTVTAVNPGLGIDTIANNTSNPNVDVEYTGANNIVDVSESIVTASGDDLVEFNQLTSSNVKSARLREVDQSMLTLIKQTIDNADLNKIKNVEPAGFTTTAGANKIITLTITEYNSIVTKDPNTLYLIIGAGTSFTQTLARDVSGITGTGTYTLSPALPQTVTGPNGTNFSFTTSISGTAGSTVTGSNMPLTTSGTIGSSDATTTQVLTATVTAASIPQCSAVLGVTLGGNLSSKLTAWQYKSGTDQPGATSAAANCPAGYSFNTEIELTNTSTYEFTAGPTYENTIGGSFTASPGFSGTASALSQTKTHGINGTIDFKDYTATVTINDNVTDPTPDPGNSWAITSNTPSSFNEVISGLHNGDNFSWNEPTTTGIQTYSATPAAGTWYWSSLSEPTFTDSVGATITFPFGDIINGANETTVINIGGTILYNAAPPVQFRKLNATAVIQAAVSGYANGTITNAVQTASGASGTYNYATNPAPPAITANTGYVLTGGVVTLATNPVTFNSTPGQSGSGTSAADPIIENDPTVTSGTITQISANLSQSQLAPASNISYNTSYFAQGGGGSTNVTTSGTNGSNTGALTIGNGTVNATVSKTAPTGQASGNGVITWNKNGSLQNTYTFNSGDYVYSSYTYTGVSNGDTLQTLITEN